MSLLLDSIIPRLAFTKLESQKEFLTMWNKYVGLTAKVSSNIHYGENLELDFFTRYEI